MFEKVLIAEDHQSTSFSVKQSLEAMHIPVCDYVYYCDDALTRIRNENRDGHPYDLLITDLSFAPDGREQQLKSGAALIAAARQVQPGLKVLVFSIENKPMIIKELFDKWEIEGYVIKGREDALQLQSAIRTVAEHGQYVPAGLRQVAKQVMIHNFTDFDMLIIGLIAQGRSQKQISVHLNQKRIRPSSLSAIEKRLGLIRNAYGFNNNEQLLIFCKESGFI